MIRSAARLRAAGCCGAVLATVLSNFAPAAHADLAAITSQNAERLTLLETDSQQVLADIALPGLPAAVVADGKRGRVMAIAVDSRRLHVFDLSGRALADWPLPGAPFGLAVRSDSGTALITGWDGFLREFDPASGRQLASWPVGAGASGVAEANGVIVTANRDDDSITIITASGSRRVAVGQHPFGVTLRAGRAFVTNVLSDSVSVVDLATAQELRRIPTGARPYAVAFAAGKGFVSNQYDASLTVFSADDFAVLAQIATDDYPEGIAATANGAQLLVACWFSDSLQVIDPQTLHVTATLAMPAGPRAFGAFVTAQP